MITLSGFKEYSGLSDKNILANKLNIPSDDTIRSQLNVATSVVRDLLALEATDPLPDNDRIDTSIYLLTQFLIENRSTQEKISKVDFEGIEEQKTSYYRAQLKDAIFKQIEGLILKDKNVLAFMPEAPA